MNLLRKYFPILTWGREYNRQTMVNDLIVAGIVTVMLIPQSLAYALLAGLPPQIGLIFADFDQREGERAAASLRYPAKQFELRQRFAAFTAERFELAHSARRDSLDHTLAQLPEAAGYGEKFFLWRKCARHRFAPQRAVTDGA